MKDQDKPREQLIAELVSLRQQIAEFQTLESKRKQAEAALDESEVRLHTVLAYTPVILWATDREGVFTFAEGKGLATMGLKPDQIIGQSVSSVYRDTPQVVDHVQRALAGETLTSTVTIAGMTFEIRYTPFQNQHGQITGVIGLATDITERKLMEELLAKSEERHRAAAELTSDYAYAFWVEADGRLVLEWVTGSFTYVTGFTTAEVEVQGGWTGLVHPDDVAIAQQRLQTLLAGRSYKSEFRIVTKSNQVRWLCDHARPVWDEIERRVVRIYGAAQDITERKQAERQIKTSLKEKEVLLKEIHHRVKNNLQLISSLLRLQSHYIKDEHALHMYQEIQYRVRSMALVHEKLYRSKDLARIDFAHYIKDLAEYLLHLYQGDAGAVTLKINVDEVLLDIDTAIPCGLIINELVTNALKHAFPLPVDKPADQTGEICIDLQIAHDNQFTLMVSDNGIGLPKDLDFGNIESLGLELVSLLIDQLEGTIEIDHSNGTTFKIRFTRSK